MESKRHFLGFGQDFVSPNVCLSVKSIRTEAFQTTFIPIIFDMLDGLLWCSIFTYSNVQCTSSFTCNMREYKKMYMTMTCNCIGKNCKHNFISRYVWINWTCTKVSFTRIILHSSDKISPLNTYSTLVLKYIEADYKNMEFLFNHLDVVFMFLKEIYVVLLNHSHVLSNFRSIYSCTLKYHNIFVYPSFLIVNCTFSNKAERSICRLDRNV